MNHLWYVYQKDKGLTIEYQTNTKEGPFNQLTRINKTLLYFLYNESLLHVSLNVCMSFLCFELLLSILSLSTYVDIQKLSVKECRFLTILNNYNYEAWRFFFEKCVRSMIICETPEILVFSHAIGSTYKLHNWGSKWYLHWSPPHYQVVSMSETHVLLRPLEKL